MDDFVLNTSNWDVQKKEEEKRAFNFCKTVLKIPLTEDEFSNVWYSQTSDKKGLQHLANMCMSIFQTRKTRAGKQFEDIIQLKHSELGILYHNQKWVDVNGIISNKKPETSCHKVDCLIPPNVECENIKDMYIISKKTTLRERYRQDLELAGKCKGVIFLTKEIPDKTKINTIVGYGCIIVYPNADCSDNVWSYEKYFSTMKNFQNTLSNNIG